MNAEPPPATPPAASGYRVEDLLIDTRLGRVTRDGVDLGITGLSFDLLIALVLAAPAAVSIDQLMEQVWRGIIVNPETVTQRVKLLRQALGDDAENPRYIAVRRGFGYRLVAAAVPLPGPQDGRATSDAAPAGRPARISFWLPVCLLALLVVAGAGWWWGLHPTSRNLPPEVHQASAPLATQGSIAVMPFANLTGEPAKDYLGDGMAEELINALSAIPGLKVSARTSSFAYKGHDTDIRRIAQDLSVATILEGSVRSAGERIRISTRLVDAHSGYQIWSQTYDRQFADLFKLQDELAAQIVQALRGYLNSNLPAPPERTPPTRDLQAYQLLLQARAVGRGTVETSIQALQLLNQALARDPEFADALAIRSYLMGGPATLGYQVPATALDAAERDARRALVLSPALPDAQDSMSAIHAVRGEWVDADLSFRATLAADPGNPFIRNIYSLHVLRPLGRLKAARSQLDESYRLAPADGFTIHEQELIDSLMGDDADALKFAHLSEALGGGGQPVGNALVLARAAARSGHYLEAAQGAADIVPPALSKSGTALMKTLYTALGDPAQRPAARRTFDQLLPKLESDAVDGQVRGAFLQAFTQLGALDSAYDLANWCVDVGVRDRMVGSRLYLADFWLPEMRPFRLDPRFQSLVARLKMIDYWLQFGPPDGCDLTDRRLSCH